MNNNNKAHSLSAFCMPCTVRRKLFPFGNKKPRLAGLPCLERASLIQMIKMSSDALNHSPFFPL